MKISSRHDFPRAFYNTQRLLCMRARLQNVISFDVGNIIREFSMHFDLQFIFLLLAIIGAIGTVFGIWKYITREKPKLNVEVLSCKHRVRSDYKATNVKLEFRVHNSGDKGTTLTKLDVSFLDWNKIPHAMTKNLKVDVDANKTTEKLEVLFTFSPTFQYAESFPCTFTLHHTHGRSPFKSNSQQSSEDLSGKAPSNAWVFG